MSQILQRHITSGRPFYLTTDTGLHRKLASIAAGKDRPVSPNLRPGGRLIREWNGVSHVVDVAEDGYIWRGARYRSLSAIARAITGAHWSGPRFFGLKADGGS